MFVISLLDKSNFFNGTLKRVLPYRTFANNSAPAFLILFPDNIKNLIFEYGNYFDKILAPMLPISFPDTLRYNKLDLPFEFFIPSNIYSIPSCPIEFPVKFKDVKILLVKTSFKTHTPDDPILFL